MDVEDEVDLEDLGDLDDWPNQKAPQRPAEINGLRNKREGVGQRATQLYQGCNCQCLVPNKEQISASCFFSSRVECPNNSFTNVSSMF